MQEEIHRRGRKILSPQKSPKIGRHAVRGKPPFGETVSFVYSFLPPSRRRNFAEEGSELGFRVEKMMEVRGGREAWAAGEFEVNFRSLRGSD